MLPSAIEEKLARFHRLLQERFGPRLQEVTLFGSHARGDAHEESDVDVLVVIDDLAHSEVADVSGLAYDVDVCGEWIGLAPLVMSTATASEMRSRERLLFKEIDSEGIRR